METLKLFGIRLFVSWRNFIEFLKVVFRYYSNSKFRKIDLYLLRNYLLQNPFQISKKYLQERGEKNIYTYGETPLTTLEVIARECGIGAEDVVCELGSGRGRGCFWLNSFIGCPVIGIEFVPTFVAIAQNVKCRYMVKEVKFLCQDILEANFRGATVVYFYGTSSETPFIQKLIDKLKKMPVGTKIITVSYPLTSYMDTPVFELIKSFQAQFTWGKTAVYLQVRK